MKQTTSPAGIVALRKREDCRLKAYLDAAKPPKWTIGVGHCGAGVVEGLEIDQPRADQLLAGDLLTAEEIVSRNVIVPLAQCQVDALCSFVFNTGPGRPDYKDGFVWLKQRDAHGQPQHSTLLLKLNRSDYAGAADQLLLWTHAGAADLAGLLTRRKGERAQFLEGIV
jgi:lysozyme